MIISETIQFETDRNWSQALLRLIPYSIYGPIAGVTAIAANPEAKRSLHMRTGALAVDTESAYLAGCAPAGRTVALRAIVDTPDAPLLRAGTVWRGVAALRALRAAAPAIDQWAAAVGDRDILLASPRSFCAGVERAIEIVAKGWCSGDRSLKVLQRFRAMDRCGKRS